MTDFSEKRFRRKIAQAVVEHQMIEANDQVVVALSGGEDSLVLLETLSYLKKRAPISFQLTAVHVKVVFPGIHRADDRLIEYCNQLGVPMEIVSTEMEDRESEKSTCFLCSWHRRKALFEYANRHEINKIAFGHHMDDILETLLMNMSYKAEISTMLPKLKMKKGNYDIIRPLCRVTKDEIGAFARHNKIVPLEGSCDYETANNRSYFRELLQDLHSHNPKAKYNIYRSLSNINMDYIQSDDKSLTKQKES